MHNAYFYSKMTLKNPGGKHEAERGGEKATEKRCSSYKKLEFLKSGAILDEIFEFRGDNQE